MMGYNKKLRWREGTKGTVSCKRVLRGEFWNIKTFTSLLKLTLYASKGFTCNAIDINSVFLQGKQIDWIVFLVPPPDFKELIMVCELTKHGMEVKNLCYGLTEAVNFRISIWVKVELCKLGIKYGSFDPFLFCWDHNYKVEGIFITHVDGCS